jgi:hypothetical protein
MDNLNKLIGLIRKLMEREKPWFGKIEVSLESGQIVNIKVTENIKL